MKVKRIWFALIFGALVLSIGSVLTSSAEQEGILKPAGLTDSEVRYVDSKRVLATRRPVGPHHMSDQSPVDTLTWRTLSETNVNFGAPVWGDTLAVWFQPLAACTLREIRIYNKDFRGTMYINLWSSRYDGHIVTKDSIDANGWIGTHENGQWIPGNVIGHSPLGEHLWGTFPLTMTESETQSWLSVPTALLGEPVLSGDPFFLGLTAFRSEGWGIAAEMEAQVPYHFFKYYAGEPGPDQTHTGWFIRSFTLWVEAVVVYFENTRPVIGNMNELNFTYSPGPYLVEARITDSDFEDPGRAGVASAFLHWNIEGIEDSVAMVGPSEGNVFTGEILTADPGDTVFYHVSATDWAGLRSSNAPYRFARLEPIHPEADILLVGEYASGVSQFGRYEPGLFYSTILESLNYSYDCWDLITLKGIDESVLNWGWSTAILFGYSAYGMPPTRDYEGNDWAAFLNAGKNLLHVNVFYYWDNNEPDVPTFAPGDFAFDYFGLVSGLTDATFYWDPVLHGVPGDPVSDNFVENPIEQTWLPDWYNWVSYTTASEEGVDIFFNDYGDGCGVRYDDGSFKTIFLPLMMDWLLEDTGTDTLPKACVYMLMQNIFEWFETKKEVDKGDVNRDGQVDVLDTLRGVNIILSQPPMPSSSELWAADCNGDGSVNILDIVGIINVILGVGTCPP